MTDKFSIITLRQLLGIILNQYDTKKEILGIPEELFFKPAKNDAFGFHRYGQFLETPVGVAAGPHTQLAQNIIAAWLTGARYIELKTVQTLDELDVSKPCIDMGDEGYNCEWSQELKIKQSFDQYLNAWILIHLLKDKLNIGSNDEPGFIFNMSVGYDYEGILKENVQWFFGKMADASVELHKKIDSIKDLYPAIDKLKINSKLSDNITLSTMHGCPPDEIEKIGYYLLTEKKLHTTVKLNPTLLGKEQLHSILENSGFDTQVPDIAFEHDLKYDDAVKIINNLRQTASDKDLFFGLKLTNTLESLNHKDIFPKKENMMYMSGRALHPISVNLAKKLQSDFNGTLDISFSAGADAFNVTNLISCGLFPVTMSSDLLKPGGYTRLNQYIENIKSGFQENHSSNPEEFITKTAGDKNLSVAKQKNIADYAAQTLESDRYKKTMFIEPSIKTARTLNSFDCIHAPCTDTCPTNQDIPDYMYFTANREYDKAFDAILKTNPFPTVTGMICDHHCQTKCTRINYDESLKIREIKRFVAEKADENYFPEKIKDKHGTPVAIIGAGLSGLSCGYILQKSGFEVNIYEQKEKAGGMAAGAIPSFRLNDDAFATDLKRIEMSGVKIRYNQHIDKKYFDELHRKNSYVYVAAGAQSTRKLNIEGCDLQGVVDPIEFLFDLKSGKKPLTGKNIAIIGGGNTAMDVARAAMRLVGENGNVTVIYRRTIKQMPAEQEEITEAVEEGVKILELTHPVRINGKDGKVNSVTLVKMKLGEKDASGRPKPVTIENSEFSMEFDTLIPAIGQDRAFDFIDEKLLKKQKGKYETGIENVFIGGDAYRGAATAIKAVGDGRKVAEIILGKEMLKPDFKFPENRIKKSLTTHKLNRAKRVFPVKTEPLPVNRRMTFDLITETLTEDEAVKEASRCLACDEVCNICTTVCPNLALQYYEINPVKLDLQMISIRNGKSEIIDDETFEVKQNYQIIHIADWCNECGNCTTFCPSAGSPYKEKPHLYLNREAFENDTGCYFFSNDNKIEYKNADTIFSLISFEDKYIFTSKGFTVTLDKTTFKIIDFKIKENTTFDLNLKKAAEMKIILEGRTGSWRIGRIGLETPVRFENQPVRE